MSDIPSRLSASIHFWLYLSTKSLHLATRFRMPTFSTISLLPPVTPISFCACSSTGSPWVSQPALKITFLPCRTLYRYHRSLMTRPLRWPACGMPFIVGGPSMNIIS